MFAEAVVWHWWLGAGLLIAGIAAMAPWHRHPLLAVAKGWQAFQIAEHAQHVAELGRELYDREATVLGHVEDTG